MRARIEAVALGQPACLTRAGSGFGGDLPVTAADLTVLGGRQDRHRPALQRGGDLTDMGLTLPLQLQVRTDQAQQHRSTDRGLTAPPGLYDLASYSWSTVDTGFVAP
ncbi:MAG: hypothetical protein WAT09_19625 [Paracoccaceae bacterium]